MALNGDSCKLSFWRQRLQDFQHSGLSMTAFCKQQNCSQATFYYWSRRVKQADSQGTRPHQPAVTAKSSNPQVTAAYVQIQIGSNICLRLPASQTNLIDAVLKTLLDYSEPCTPAANNVTKDHGNFQRINVA